MKLWLTVCHGGRGMLTVFRPKIARIRGTHHLDAFEQLGEPIAVRYLCQGGMRSLFGRIPKELVPTKVEVTAIFLEAESDASLEEIAILARAALLAHELEIKHGLAQKGADEKDEA